MQSAERIPLQLSSNCIIASLQVDLTQEVLDMFRSDLLARLADCNANGVILDVSGVEVMDLEEFDALMKVVDMAQLMGALTLFSGFRPGVVSALVGLEADTARVRAARDLDDAFRIFDEALLSPEPQGDEDETLETQDVGPELH